MSDKRIDKNSPDEVMRDIRKLLILLCSDKGYTLEQISKILGVSRPTVSKYFPGGLPKKD